MNWQVRRATVEDIKDISQRLRTHDVKEIFASTGMTPEEALMFSQEVDSVGVWVGTKDGIVEIIFGLVRSDDPDLGVPWMVCTDALAASPMTFMRLCRKWVEGFSRQFKRIANFVHAENELHIKWLNWCGFEFVKLHEEHGFTKEPFWEFEMIQSEER